MTVLQEELDLDGGTAKPTPTAQCLYLDCLLAQTGEVGLFAPYLRFSLWFCQTLNISGSGFGAVLPPDANSYKQYLMQTRVKQQSLHLQYHDALLDTLVY